MSNISKEKWEEIEQVLQGYFFDGVCFNYKGYALTVQRRGMGEGKTALVVFINGSIKGGWSQPKDDAPQIIPEVWRHRTKSLYPPKERKEIERHMGKRYVKKHSLELNQKIEWYDAFFPKASVLCRQFKKLEGLEFSDASSSEHLTSEL